MTRYLAAALLLGSFATCSLVGCAEKSEVTTETTAKTPEGTIKETDTKKIEKTGDAKESAAPAPVDAPKAVDAPH